MKTFSDIEKHVLLRSPHRKKYEYTSLGKE